MSAKKTRIAEGVKKQAVGLTLRPFFRVPTYESRDSDSHGSCRDKAEVSTNVVDICKGLMNVAILHRQQDYLSFSIACLFDCLN